MLCKPKLLFLTVLMQAAARQKSLLISKVQDGQLCFLGQLQATAA